MILLISLKIYIDIMSTIIIIGNIGITNVVDAIIKVKIISCTIIENRQKYEYYNNKKHYHDCYRYASH